MIHAKIEQQFNYKQNKGEKKLRLRAEFNIKYNSLWNFFYNIFRLKSEICYKHVGKRIFLTSNKLLHRHDPSLVDETKPNQTQYIYSVPCCE